MRYSQQTKRRPQSSQGGETPNKKKRQNMRPGFINWGRREAWPTSRKGWKSSGESGGGEPKRISVGKKRRDQGATNPTKEYESKKKKEGGDGLINHKKKKLQQGKKKDRTKMKPLGKVTPGSVRGKKKGEICHTVKNQKNIEGS